MISTTSVKYTVAFGALLIAALAFSLLVNQSAQGASESTGVQYAGGVGDENGIGTADDAFGSPFGDCNSPDYCAEVGQGEDEGEYDEYGFSIAGGPEILGIEVTVAGTPGSNDVPKVQLLDAAGDPVGDQKTLSTPGSYSSQTVGGSTDLWGTTWDEATIEDADFGVEIIDDGGTGGGFLLDAIGITVHYDNDLDNDGVLNDADNCPEVANPGQLNADEHLAANGARMGPTTGPTVAPLPSDAAGDQCDSDDDNDGFSDEVEDHIRTNPQDNCYGGPTPEATPQGYSDLEINDGWPPDIAADTHANEDDLDILSANFNLPVDTVLRQRLDAAIDANDEINVTDVGALFSGKVGWDCE